MIKNAVSRLFRGSIFVYGLLGGIIILGAWLRLGTLDYQEVWYDEAYSGLLVRHTWSEMFTFIRADVHPPVYYIILKAWVTVAGPSDFALRLPSAVAGIILLPVVFWFITLLNGSTHNRRGHWIALAATYLIAVNPFLIEYSQEARGYTLVALWLTLAASWFWRALRTSPLATNHAWVAWSICIGLAFLTHYLSALGIVVFGLIAGWVIVPEARRQHLAWHIVLRQHWLTILPGMMLFLGWLPALWQQVSLADPLWWIPPAHPTFWFRSIGAFLFGVDHHALNVPPINQISPWIATETIGWILGGLIVIWSVWALRRRDQGDRASNWYMLLLWLLPLLGITLISHLGVQWYVERYLIAYGVFFLLYLVWLLAQFPRIMLISTLVIYSTVLLFQPIVPQQRDCYKRCTYVNVTQSVARTVTNNPFDFFVLRYYYPERDIKLYDLNNTNHYTTWDMVSDTDILTRSQQLQPDDLRLLTEPSIH